MLITCVSGSHVKLFSRVSLGIRLLSAHWSAKSFELYFPSKNDTSNSVLSGNLAVLFSMMLMEPAGYFLGAACLARLLAL